MFGFDWPMCNVTGGYGRMYTLVADYVARLSAAEQVQFWGANAVRFYDLAAR
jgi:predicted TIM-barrel fold metal-dependent hydrolase